MFLLNSTQAYRSPMVAIDADMLGDQAAREVERYLSYRQGNTATPIVSLPGLATELGLRSIHLKDEGHRLGLGSFKALGGSYAVIRLVLQEASRRLGRVVDVSELETPHVRSVAEAMTVACATDGNHGRSVAQGAQLVGARAAIFIHSGVSEERAAAIASFGANIIRVSGNYDDSVRDAARVADERGWIVVSDTSWPGYETIPGLVMQGYTAVVSEALRQLPLPPTHVFIQSGVGGIAAAIAGRMAVVLGSQRPVITVVDPARAACIYESAKAGYPVSVPHGEPTVMAMLECYEPSLVAWRILSRVADAFMTIDEDDAVGVMRALAKPLPGDPVVIAGESGGVGLAALINAVKEPSIKASLKLDKTSRVLLVNTEGATDPSRYRQIVGASPEAVLSGDTSR